jgi:hypothetical protein
MKSILPSLVSGGAGFYDTLVGVPTLANINAARKDKEHAVILLKGAKQRKRILK